MKEINLPHKDPVKFAKYVISNNGDIAFVKVEFTTLPSLAMIIEASAQSTAGLSSSGKSQMGYLVSLKNIKLLKELTNLKYDVKIVKEHELGALTYFYFEVYEENKREDSLVKGTFIIAIN